MSKNSNLTAIILITSLFFLWGFALNLNPILIPHLKKACQLSDFQSSWIDSASYFAYFVMPIPAALFMSRFSYKSGIILGLLLFSFGALLTFPAAQYRNYGFFLASWFVVFSGMAFLETAANPLITVLGEPAKATQRINFAQSFNGLAATLGPLAGGMFILSGKTLTEAEEKAMSPSQLSAYLDHEASSVQVPFIVISLVVFLVAVMVWRTAFPVIHEENEIDTESRPLGDRIAELLKNKQLMTGVLAEFFYVGGQACVSSFFIRFSEKVAQISEKTASTIYLPLAFLGFMVGRFVGTALMRYFNPVKLLVTYAVINIILIISAVNLTGMAAVYTLMAVWFFMSIMFPTIFSLSIRDLTPSTKKLGSSLVIMGIVGGAILPPVMGRISDAFNIQVAYLIPGISFAAILMFAIANLKVKTVEVVGGH